MRLSLSLVCPLFAVGLLLSAATIVAAQTPEPAPSPTPTPVPAKPAEIPDPLTDLQKASELQDKPEFRQSDIKTTAPLFNPEKEALFTVPSNYRKPGRLKVGLFFPQSSDLRDATASTYFSFGGSLDLPPRGITRPFTPELYLDSAFRVDDSNNEASLIGGGIGFRFYPGAKPGAMARTLNNPRLFVGGGVGAYFLRYDIGTASESGVTFGGKASLGLDFEGDWSLEGTYTFVGELENTSFSGFGVLLGYRF